jgi:hypothetical protein
MYLPRVLLSVVLVASSFAFGGMYGRVTSMMVFLVYGR